MRPITIQTSHSTRLQGLVGGSKARKPGRYKNVKDRNRNLIKTNETIHTSVHVFLDKRIVDGCDALEGLTRNEAGVYHQTNSQAFETSQLSLTEPNQDTFEREILETWTLRMLLQFTLTQIGPYAHREYKREGLPEKQNCYPGGSAEKLDKLDVRAIPIYFLLRNPQDWTVETVEGGHGFNLKVHGEVSWNSSTFTKSNIDQWFEWAEWVTVSRVISIRFGWGNKPPWWQEIIVPRRLNLRGTIEIFVPDGEDPFAAKLPSLKEHLGRSV